MTEGWAYDATGGAALARAGERYQLPYRPAANAHLGDVQLENAVNHWIPNMMLPPEQLFCFMVPPQGEPLWDFAYPMLGGPIDPKISDINQKIDYSLSVVGWPMHPTVLRDSAKCVLQDICNRYSSRPLTNAQNGRVQQFVTKVNVYCWYKALPALPVTWVLQPRFDGI